MVIRRFILTAVLLAAFVSGLCKPLHYALANVSGGLASDRRVALVIGNSRYGSVAPLVDPERDSRAVAATLTELGFSKVMLEADLPRDRFLSRLRTFAELADHADWAIVYFAGHGIEVNGDDFLLPVDARVLTDTDVESEAISLRQLTAATAKAANVRLVIIDASRSNPFFASTTREMGDHRNDEGLAPPGPTGDVAVVLSAKAGQLAREGGQFANSPFVASLVKSLRKPGLDLDASFHRTRNEVIVSTGGLQEPALYGTLPKLAANTAGRTGGISLSDDAAWESLGATVDRTSLTRFTEQFPRSPWSAAAHVRLAELQRALVISDAIRDDKSATDTIDDTPVTISCGTPGVELTFCEREVAIWARNTGNKVKVIPAPAPMDDRLNLYLKSLESQETNLDIMQIDVTWSGILADNLVDLYAYSSGTENESLPTALDAAVVSDRLVAMPWFVDSGLLFYRKDLLAKYGLKPPQTWEELAESAAAIQKGERARGKRKFQGFLFNGLAAEGLTCFALEMINAYGGQVKNDENGVLSIDAAATEQALKTMSGWIGNISPKRVVRLSEEAARQEFQNGNVAFMRNWPYVLHLTEENSSNLRGKVGVTPLPRGGVLGNRTGVLGGWQLAVSKYSRQRKKAASLVLFLTGIEVQKERAIEGGYAPALGALYRDPDVLKSNAIFPDMYTAVTNSIVRPSRLLGPKYDDFSTILREEVKDALSGKTSPEAAAEAINTRLYALRAPQQK
ncbi:extracellular solute-binding protein [Mesorhizobium australicum]|uniref:extracellular solute-binding protein n=2 Tax=Mesorhizobium TaxID=68287 RepID=UPI003334E3B0